MPRSLSRLGHMGRFFRAGGALGRRALAVAGMAGLAGALALGSTAAGQDAGGGGSEVGAGLERFAPDRVEAQRALERAIIDAVDRDRLRGFMHRMAADPHPAGSEADLALIEWMAETFEGWGLETEIQWFDAYLAHPVSASVAIESPERVELMIQEAAVEGDPHSAHPDLSFGWNAYSGSGTASGEVVYANYGRLEDFERLEELGVEVSGKIVLARYGGNYRGYKAKFAERAGAAGLIIFTDPGNEGYARGLPWPEGGYANETSIQRGSIKTLEFVGDPLTPGEFAAPVDGDGGGVDRLDPDEVELPTIPVQPIGWAAAMEIMSRMEGDEIADGSWQGGLACRHRLTGGSDLVVRVSVEQERRLTRTANVIGTLKGSAHPDEQVIIGCHHDAWTAGAGDPLAGLICLFECARVLADRAVNHGERPERTIVFAAWGAEEYGIIGSTEFVESRRERLERDAIAYINLDMAAMGPDFRASAWPSLKRAVIDATRDVPPAAAMSSSTVYADWRGRSGDGEIGVGTLGGGSDHVPFLMHAGVPSIALGAGGSRGVSYHSAYDNIAWYEKVVGDDYGSAVMITRVLGVLATRLANADLHPVHPSETLREARDQVADLRRRAEAAGLLSDAVARGLDLLEQRAGEIADQLDASHSAAVSALGNGRLSSGSHHALVNEALRGLDRGWLGAPDPGMATGLTGRPWFRNLLVATDENSGYASWALPELRRAIERGDAGAVDEAIQRYAFTIELIGSLNRMALDGMQGRQAE
ncbi:MAG: M28 family peptidase [Phycisphaerales bacterium]